MKDEEIVALYWERNEDAVLETAQKYGAYLSKIAYNVLSNPEDSEECVNDTYLRAWNSMPVHRPSVLSGYLGKIVRQLSIDVFRKRYALKRHASAYCDSLSELEDVCSGGSNTEQAVDAILLDNAINRFLRALPEDARNCFIGRYFFFDSLKEVAAYCGMTEAGTKSMLFRTRQSLKAHLIQEGFEP